MAHLTFSAYNASPDTYKLFIKNLRDLLIARGRPPVHGIPVLARRQDVRPEQRFLLVDLTTFGGITIRVAIDVVSVYVVAYAAGNPINRSYFLLETAPNNRPPIHVLFPGTHRSDLHFDGTYGGLESFARGRGTIPLGRNELNDAISMLDLAGNQASRALAVIVIIQMLSEAARFKAIEGLLRTTMREHYDPVLPALGVQTLETHWSDVSEQIQRAGANGHFPRAIELRTNGGVRVPVRNVADPFIQGIALQLYDQEQDCIQPGPSGRMPRPGPSGRPRR